MPTSDTRDDRLVRCSSPSSTTRTHGRVRTAALRGSFVQASDLLLTLQRNGTATRGPNRGSIPEEPVWDEGLGRRRWYHGPIIDEPERHLHRSIISPLLSQLFERRPDCGFVVSTHDHDLPLEMPGAKILLLRACDFDRTNAKCWDVDSLPSNTPIDDSLKRNLLGARRRILFVEGTESSMDKPLYSLIFPMVSLIAKGSCHDVERAVLGVRVGECFHWLQAFGIIDGDGYQIDQIEIKRSNGIYALPFYSIEAIYYHPRIIEWIAHRMSGVKGEDPSALVGDALAADISAIANHTERVLAGKWSRRRFVNSW